MGKIRHTQYAEIMHLVAALEADLKLIPGGILRYKNKICIHPLGKNSFIGDLIIWKFCKRRGLMIRKVNKIKTKYCVDWFQDTSDPKSSHFRFKINLGDLEHSSDIDRTFHLDNIFN